MENYPNKHTKHKLLCCSSSFIVSLLPQSLSSFSECAAKRKLMMDEDTGGDISATTANGYSGVVIRASAFRKSFTSRRGLNRHDRRQLLGAVPILTLLSLVVILSFLSPPVTPGIRVRRHLAMEPTDEPGLHKEERSLWATSSSESFHGCSAASDKFLTADLKTEPDRYLLISTSGGLNQQRTGITDSVVAAYILNATLIVPMLDQDSYWKDSSEFSDIFDVERFISFLSNDVKIIKQLPAVGGNVTTPLHVRVARKSTPESYLHRILPILKKKHAVQLTKFDYRLSNRLGTDLQKLRCRVNYHALQFTDLILNMGRTLVDRMRMKSKHFVTLHLRFEPDMLAFSGCYYGGGEKERGDLGELRKRWKNLHISNPEKQRRQGRCPLTPGEVGFMLRALGYGSDVHIYVASGEIYGGEETLSPLRNLFPNIYTKDSLTSKEELDPFKAYSARMAALDFIVCDESDVFVTNNNGNMAKILAGRRRYFGHKPTIRPNAKKLYRLFLNRTNMPWREFTEGVRTQQTGFMGEPQETKTGRGEFHENPEDCICQTSPAKIGGEHSTLVERPSSFYQNQNEVRLSTKPSDSGELTDDQSLEEDHEQSELDYLDNDDEVRRDKQRESNLNRLHSD